MPNRGPFRRLVILGDSNSYGMCAHEAAQRVESSPRALAAAFSRRAA